MTTTEELNQSVIRRLFHELVNAGDFTVVDDIYRPDVVDHQPLPGAPAGREGVRYTIAVLRDSFPDLHVTIDESHAYADRVVIRYTWRGTHTRELLGIAPTGRSIEYQGVAEWRLIDGRIADRWDLGIGSGILPALGLGWLARGRLRAGKFRSARARRRAEGTQR
ncbi:ester cyclase [Nocardia sp. bgisy134]|uniref:ester cyclase n=1 Tax=Nocardia sp. bgisy134 TaxID=3413789 RepID=UPI003D7531E7